MAEDRLPDYGLRINRSQQFLNIPAVSLAKERLENSLSILNGVLKIALARDLTLDPTEAIETYFRIVNNQVHHLDAKIYELWLAVHQEQGISPKLRKIT